MPPHLHPRSRMTSSLFATTLAASFLVVGLPHILPCPAPRVAYADASSSSSSPSPDGSAPRRPRRRRQDTKVKDGLAQFESVSGEHARPQTETSRRPSDGATDTQTIHSTAPRGKRECPVPKPGAIGELIGFKREERNLVASSNGTETETETERGTGTGKGMGTVSGPGEGRRNGGESTGNQR
ncbi:hypothetical protein GGR50DRAFT_67662 [Xylaria sp. CBS 124048]|nr:hypothetical protein GGR50DRAFT_67662 [Xylaria sp. CBS 124048]